MGNALYIYATKLSYKGLLATAYVGPIPLASSIFFKILLTCYRKHKYGEFWNKSRSNFINEDNTIKKVNFWPLLVNIYANCAHYTFFTLAFKYAKLAGINQGVVTIMVIMATIFNSISFYFAFGEKPSCTKIIGICFSASITIFLGINGVLQDDSDLKVKNADGDSSRTAYSFYSLGFATLVPIGFSLKHFFIRKFKGSYNSFDLVMDSSIGENAVFCIVSIYQATNGGFNTTELLYGGASGVLRNFGNQFMGIGISFGQGAAGQALMTTNSLWLTFFTVIFDG